MAVERNMAEGTPALEGAAIASGSSTAVVDRNRDVPNPETRLRNWLNGQLVESGQKDATVNTESQLNPQARADIDNALKNADADSLSQGTNEPAVVAVKAEIPLTENPVKPAYVRQYTKEEVTENALLSDEARLKEAQDLLGIQFTKPQEKAFFRAHEKGSGGIYNYSLHELEEKLDILEKAGFSKEQRFALLKAGYAGRLPAAEFSGFNKTPYKNTPLEPIAEEILEIGVTDSAADEVYLKGTAERIQRLVDAGTVTYAQAKDLIRNVNIWRITAEQIPTVAARPARPAGSTSVYEQIRNNLENARRNANQAAFQAELLRRQTLLEEIDALRGLNGERLELFSVARDPLVALYYGSRVGVGQKERLGAEEHEGRGTLERLSILQRVLDPNAAIEDRTGRISQIVQNSSIFLGEERTLFWDDPQNQTRIQAMENLPEVVAFKQRWGVQSLEQALRGSIDYFNREGLNMITEVVKDRKSYTPADPLNRRYPNNGLYDVWNTVIRDKIGRHLKDEEGREVTAANFDDVREAIEEARRQEPWIANRGDYETWIQFVADDPEELEEMIPYIVARVKRKLGTGEPNSVYQTLTQEKEKMDKAMAAFPTENERQFRRLKSILTANFNLMGAQFFSDLVRKDWQPYSHFMDFLATAFQDTEYQDHFVDSALLDKDGFTMLAGEEYFQNDGEFWRYGQKSADVGKMADDTGALLEWQQRRRAEIEEKLMGFKLKSMRGLLGISVGGAVPQGPRHPAFQRLKDKLDALDAQDLARHNQGFKPRWDEYCEKALLWESTRGQIFGDPRDHVQRVIFQHPLARVLRPVGFEDGYGNITAVDELTLMFEPDTNNDKWYRAVKRRKVRATLEKTERIARAFVQDSAAAVAWHIFPTQADLAEARRYININPGEAAAHKTLLRGMLQAAIREDQNKPPELQKFKLYHLLTQKLGVDIDSPLFAAWYLGAHDTFRPTLLRYIYQEPDFAQILATNLDRRNRKVKLVDGRDDPTAADEKTTIARWAEDERRIILAMELVLRRKFPNYFNFPGHDTPGAGVKDIRNPLLPAYGTSTDTVEINALIRDMLAGEGEYGKHYGITRSLIRQLVGLTKGSDEIFFMETGGIIENPRDTESWVKRFFGDIHEYQLWTKGDEKGSPHGLLNDGPISGAYHLRVRNRDARNYPNSKTNEFATENPGAAYNEMHEDAYEAYVDAAAKFVAPLMAVMHLRLSEMDSTYGRNPGSALFLNTLLWYSISRWMDENPEEFRVKFGFAYDVDLPLARIFIHTVLYESRLIHNDKQWDEIMVGYTRIERNGKVINVPRYNIDAAGNTIVAEEIKIGTETVVNKSEKIGKTQGEVHEGLIDAFPADLREEIIDNKWLPMGINSYMPETLRVLTEHYSKEGSERTRGIYKMAAKLVGKETKPRETISRP